jgi:hypothetical protein
VLAIFFPNRQKIAQNSVHNIDPGNRLYHFNLTLCPVRPMLWF